MQAAEAVMDGYMEIKQTWSLTGPSEAPGLTFSSCDAYFLNKCGAVRPGTNRGWMAVLLPLLSSASSYGFRELAWDFKTSADFCSS